MRSAPASKVAQLGDREHPVSEPFRNWLKVVNAIDEADRMELPNAHATIMSARNDAQSWLSITLPASMGTGPMTAVQLLSFRTPVGAATEKQTGRMVLADFHVTPMDPPGGTLFSRCSPGSSELTPQEKALAYMLFDLSNDPVVVPPG